MMDGTIRRRSRSTGGLEHVASSYAPYASGFGPVRDAAGEPTEPATAASIMDPANRREAEVAIDVAEARIF
jgi:hypothetical protein